MNDYSNETHRFLWEQDMGMSIDDGNGDWLDNEADVEGPPSPPRGGDHIPADTS